MPKILQSSMCIILQNYNTSIKVERTSIVFPRLLFEQPKSKISKSTWKFSTRSICGHKPLNRVPLNVNYYFSVQNEKKNGFNHLTGSFIHPFIEQKHLFDVCHVFSLSLFLFLFMKNDEENEYVYTIFSAHFNVLRNWMYVRQMISDSEKPRERESEWETSVSLTIVKIFPYVQFQGKKHSSHIANDAQRKKNSCIYSIFSVYHLL